jgi:hypothetical protein
MGNVVPYVEDKSIVRIPTNLPISLVPALPASIDKVNRLAVAIKERLQPCPFVTEHTLHGGLYTRTVRLPADTVCAAVLIKVPTMLIIAGSADVYSNDEVIHVDGYTVLPGARGRKIAFTTYSEVAMSMVFPTAAKTVDEAQREFTDEHERLVPLSKAEDHLVLITGE